MRYYYKNILLILILLFSKNIYADTRIITNSVAITIDDIIGGDAINVTKAIEIEQDPANSDFVCGIKSGNPVTFKNATSGVAETFTSGLNSFDLLVIFPANCLNGSNELKITGVIPADVANDETFNANFKLAIRYN
jgi:hypothetical protein